MTLKFEEPGTQENHRHDHAGIVRELKSRPGEWAVVFEGVSGNLANQIRKGALKAWRPVGHFEVTVRGVDQATGNAEKIYARYIGEAE